MIRVNENYCIDVDDKCYTVKIDKHKVDKKGNPVYEIVGYFKNLENAIKGVIDSINKKKLQSDYTLKEALTIIQESNRKFEELMKEVISIKE